MLRWVMLPVLAVATAAALTLLILEVAVEEPFRQSDSRGIIATPTRDGRTPTPGPPSPTPTPTATATPTPTPVPPFIDRGCYDARTPDPNYVVGPADPKSVFQNCQVVTYYGNPQHPGLGVLGEGTTEQMLARLQVEVDAFDAANGERGVVPGYHVIFAVAQAFRTDDGTALSRLPPSEVQPYIDLAEAQDSIVILDLQMGWSTVDAEVAHVREFLDHPRVHLALDPEWAMPEGVIPGTHIGSMDASEINRAQEILQEIAVETGVRKILVVHQFNEGMITNKAAIEDFPMVDLVIDMDGFGGAGAKTSVYNRFVRDDGAEHAGFKLFYDEDIGLMSAAEVNALDPQPDFIIYQ